MRVIAQALAPLQRFAAATRTRTFARAHTRARLRARVVRVVRVWRIELGPFFKQIAREGNLPIHFENSRVLPAAKSYAGTLGARLR